MASQVERLAVLETELREVRAIMSTNTVKLDRIHDMVSEARGAAKMGRWIGHGITAAIAAVVSLAGGHFPSFH